MANIGSASNNATGSNVVRSAIMDRIDSCLDRIADLECSLQDAQIEMNEEKFNKIKATIQRQQSEIKKLEAELRALSYTL